MKKEKKSALTDREISVREYILRNGYITQRDAVIDLNINQLPCLIFKMKQKGLLIESVSSKGGNGKYYTKYRFQKPAEPPKVQEELFK